MGDFRFVLEASGGHGCQRLSGNGQTIYGCGSLHCPDCIIREFLSYLARTKGWSISKAELVHWPADMEDRGYTKEGEVRDNLLTRIRTGNFPEALDFKKSE